MAGQVGYGVIEVEDFAYGHEFQGFPSGGIFARMVVVVPFDVGWKSHPVIYVCKRPDIGGGNDVVIHKPYVLAVMFGRHVVDNSCPQMNLDSANVFEENQPEFEIEAVNYNEL